MKTLVLMRHCQASRFSRRGDYNRELTEAGHEQAREIAQKLSGQIPRIDQALISAATRARQSAVFLAVELEADDISYLPDLYDVDEWGLLNILRSDAQGDCVLVVGHQPTISAATNLLIDEAGNPVNAPTGTVLILNFEGEWADLHPGGAHLENQIFTPARN